MFKKGQSGNIKGKPRGIKNDPQIMAIRTLLEDAFLRNRTLALKTIDDMFKNREDFKFLLSLKATFEPKPKQLLEHSGNIEGTQITVTAISTNTKHEDSGIPNHETTNRSTEVLNG